MLVCYYYLVKNNKNLTKTSKILLIITGVGFILFLLALTTNNPWWPISVAFGFALYGPPVLIVLAIAIFIAEYKHKKINIVNNQKVLENFKIQKLSFRAILLYFLLILPLIFLAYMVYKNSGLF